MVSRVSARVMTSLVAERHAGVMLGKGDRPA